MLQIKRGRTRTLQSETLGEIDRAYSDHVSDRASNDHMIDRACNDHVIDRAYGDHFIDQDYMIDTAPLNT
ncbi:hypothetical protein J6590_070411 [Homalodisca vitripennis]|nr:hypothetical protein J6590_070411 [Homalodisca vitripennis]